jgi:DNA polymerase-1
LNPRSPKQLSAWLGIPSTAKKVLKQMNHPHAKLLTRYRCAEKAGGTYYQPILDLLDEHGVLHPQLNLTRDPSDVGGTRSGRLSCSKPNFQALPKTDDIYRVRECVIARPGYVILSCDYERAEVWMAGSFCGDPAIEAAYYQDVDLYEGLAAELKVTRDQAKIVFLAIQYGVGAWKLGLMLGIPEEAARGIIHDFRRSYPRIARAMYAHAQEAEETGEITLFTGRKAHFDGEVSTFYSGWNRRVQGSVGEMMRLTQQALESPLDSYGAHMLLQVHDELMVECPVENVRPVAALVQAVATSFDEFALRPRISIGVGANYEDAKKAA